MNQEHLCAIPETAVWGIIAVISAVAITFILSMRWAYHTGHTDGRMRAFLDKS